MSDSYKNILRKITLVLFTAVFTLLCTIQVNGQSTPVPSPSGGQPGDWLPYGSYFGYQRSQLQYTDAELGVVGGGPGTSFYITDVGFILRTPASFPAPSTPLKVYIKQATSALPLTATTYSAALAGYSLVFDGTLALSNGATGAQSVHLPIPFYYTRAATTDLEIIVETNTGGTGFGFSTTTEWGQTNTATNQFQYWLQDNSPPTGTGGLDVFRPDLQLGWHAITSACVPLGVISATTSNALVCTGVQFGLTAQGVVTGPTNYPGPYTYQWQSSPTGGVPWTNVGPVSNNPFFTTTEASTLYYQCVVTCGATPYTTTPSVLVTFQVCYCSAQATNGGDTDIGEIKFGAIDNPVGGALPVLNNSTAHNTFTDFTGLPAKNFQQGVSYPFTCSQITTTGTFWSAAVSVYIDFNGDGFGIGDKVLFSGNTGASPFLTFTSSPTVTDLTGSIFIPYSATPGLKRMRVSLREIEFGGGGPANDNPCESFAWGEVEDYLINVTPAASVCNVTAPGTTTSNFNSVCANQPFVLDIGGTAGYGSGMSFQWEYNSGSGWFDLAPGVATYYPYTVTSQTVATQYRMRITCPASGVSNSTPVSVAQNPPNLCLCVPIHPACPSDSYITNVTLNGTTLNNSTSCSSGNGNAYTIFPSTPHPGPTTADVISGSSYPLSVTTNLGGTNAIVSAWLDCQAPLGVFTASEWVQVATNAVGGNASTVTLNIPSGVTPGQYALRIRSRNAGSPNGAGDACTQFFSGEAEDYIVYVTAPAPTPCTNANIHGLATVASQTNFCAGSQINFTLSPSLTNPIVYSNITFQWKMYDFTTSTWVNAPGISNGSSYSTIVTQTPNAVYHCVMSCSAGPLDSSSNSTTLNVSAASWLGFNDDWNDPTNWCGRVPQPTDPSRINKSWATTTGGRPTASYVFPKVALGDSVQPKSLDVSSLDSMTIVTDSAVYVKIAGDLTNAGSVAILSTQAADTATIGNGAGLSPTFGQIFRGKTEYDLIYQIIYSRNDLDAIGLKPGNVIDSLLFQMRVRQSVNPFKNFRISYLQVPGAIPNAAAAPLPGAFTTVYGPQNLLTSAPINGQWTPYTPAIVKTFNGTTNGTQTVTGAIPAGISIGDIVTGPGIPANNYVTAFSGTNITMLISASGSTTGTITVTNSGGWLRLGTLPNSMTWNGTDNIVLQFCYDMSAADPLPIINGTSDELYLTSTGTQKSTTFLSNGSGSANANSGCSLTTGSPGLSPTLTKSPGTDRPNITFRFHDTQKRLTAGVTGQIVNSATGKMWISNTDLTVTGNVTSAGTFNVLDTVNLVTAALTNNGTLNFPVAARASIVGPVTNNTTVNVIDSSYATFQSACTNAGTFNFLTKSKGTFGSTFTSSGTLNVLNSSAAIVTGAASVTGTLNIKNNASGLFNGNLSSSTATNILDSASAQVQGDLTLGGTTTFSTMGVGLKRGALLFNGPNWTNNGTFIPGNSRITFGSSPIQTLGGTVNTPFYDLNIQKAASADYITMNQKITIADSLALRNGQLRMNKNEIDITNNLPWAALRTSAGAPVVSSTAITATGSSTSFTVGSVGTAIVGDIIVSNSLVTTIPTYIVGINGNVITFFPPASGTPAVSNPVTICRPGYLIGEDSLSRVNWTIGAVANGLRSVPFTNTNLSYVPVNFNNATPIDMGVVSFATYKAVANLPLPPTVNHINSAGPTTKSYTVNLTSGAVSISGAGFASVVGDQVTGIGIAPGTVVVNTPAAPTATLFYISLPITSSGVGVTVTTGQGVPAGVNNDQYTADRFWILSKTSSAALVPQTALTFTMAQDERPAPIATAPFITNYNTLSNLLRPQTWFIQTTPTYAGQWRRLLTPTYSFAPVPAVTANTFSWVTTINNYNWAFGNYNPWAVTLLNEPLPIELLSFDATLKGKDVLLDWSTASEKDNDFFTIERTLDFEKNIEIGRIPSQGNSTSIQKYSTWDYEPVEGKVNYYRLLQTDKDGTSTIASDYVPVKVGLESKFEIVYVRNENNVDVIFDCDCDSPVSYTLYDLEGRVIAGGSGITASQGLNILRLESASLAHGMYLISLTNKDKTITQKFVY